MILTPDIQAHGVAHPARNSGLNPSGNPSDSQLDRASEILYIPPSTSDTGSSVPSNSLHINANLIGANISGVAQGDDGRYGIRDARHNEEPSSGMGDFADDSDFPHHFQEPFPAHFSTTNTGQNEWAFPSDPRIVSSSQGKFHFDSIGYADDNTMSPAAENNYVAPEQPLRLGEVVRGSITPLSPVPTQRTTVIIPPPRTLPMSQMGTTVIRVGCIVL